jgi:acetyl esterase/lipase
MAHPHPDVPKIESTENFRGAVLLSPWVSFDISAPAMKTNQYKDCLKDVALKYWGDQFMGAAKVDPYNQPLTAPAGWWLALNVDEILVVAGRDELLVDHIREFARKLEVKMQLPWLGDIGPWKSR